MVRVCYKRVEHVRVKQRQYLVDLVELVDKSHDANVQLRDVHEDIVDKVVSNQKK